MHPAGQPAAVLCGVVEEGGEVGVAGLARDVCGRLVQVVRGGGVGAGRQQRGNDFKMLALCREMKRRVAHCVPGVEVALCGDLNTRYSMGAFWKINPRLRTDYKWNDNDPGNEVTIKPSVRTNYRAFDNWDLEVELGGEWRKTETTLTTDDHMG